MDAQGRLFRLFAIYMFVFSIYILVFYSHEETGRLTVWQMESKTRYLKISLRNRVYHLHKFISFTDNCRENKTKFFFFTITERILARWLVKSDGLWEYSPLKWRNVSRSAGRFVFGFS